MKSQHIWNSSFLTDAIDNYYQYNPDTLMPLLMLSLAAQQQLAVRSVVRKDETVFASIDLIEVMDYEWVRLNPALKKRFKSAITAGERFVYAVGSIPSSLSEIYETFHEYDTVTVVREYHHRKGILVLHSERVESDKAERQYATILLAERLIGSPQDWLRKWYLRLANKILVDSGIQPRRPRIRVAETLCALLQYDGAGVVYNPFAGCAIAAAMIGANDDLFVDGDANEKLLAISRLLCYGMGRRGCHVEMRDSLEWMQKGKPDFVMSTYLGHPQGTTAFDFCLRHCLEDFSGSGKYAGIAAPKDVFERQSPEMMEALRRDWVETIVLLPFGEVAILINAAKPEERKRKVLFYNLTHPMLSNRQIKGVLKDEGYAEVLKVSDVKKRGFLRSLVVPEIEPQEGFEIVTLGQFYERIPRQAWDLSHVSEDKRVLAKIDRDVPYDMWAGAWMQGIIKQPVSSLFSPAYKLDCEALIVSSSGALEPRLFNECLGSAFFQGGWAFKKKAPFENYDYDWLIQELNKSYVSHQLHPYGIDEMVPEPLSEEQVLQLKLYRPIEEDVPDNEIDENAGKLPGGTVLEGDNSIKYTVHGFLGHGYFGYTYSAESFNLASGEKKEVVLKEFFPYRYYHRDGLKAVLNDPDYVVFEIENRDKFLEEAKIMHRLGLQPDSHIVPAYEYFMSRATDTCYYVMPFYKDGSLDDLFKSDFMFTEEMLVQHIVIPMCKALHIAHKNRVLHLDIKPENILLDDKGDAVLIDFGVAKQYGSDNRILNREGSTSSSMFAPPELKTHDQMVKFGEQPDIFGLASSIYYLATSGSAPHPVMDFSEQDVDLRVEMGRWGMSDQFADAIVAGLQFSATSRPRNAQAFLNLFPGCEDIIL